MTSLFAAPDIDIVPRDYQQRCIEAIVDSWYESPGSLARLATGCGKTIVGSLAIQQWLARGKEYRAIVLAHERQLVWQFAQEIEDVLKIRPDIEMGKTFASGKQLVTVASRQTLRVATDEEGNQVSRMHKFSPLLKWLVICDEAHRWSRGLVSVAPIIEWFEQNPESRRLGLTATPERSDGVSLESLFPTIASDYRLYARGEPNAVDDGWAVPYDQRFVEVEGVDFKNIESVAGDFSDADLEEVLGKREMLSSLINPMLEIVGDRSTLIFSPTKAMASAVAQQINADLKQDTARSLDGSVPEAERKETYRGHQRGDFQFLSVCGLCREGYNDPNIGAVAVFRPTKSRALAEQMKGRGCRPLKGSVDGLSTPEARKEKIQNSEKPSCIIVDLVGITGIADCASTVELYADGLPDEVVDWANQLMLAGHTDVKEALDEAEKAIEEQRRLEAARAKARQEYNERVEAQRRARIEADVKFVETKIEQGNRLPAPRNEYGDILATVKQKGFLSWKKIAFEPGITKVEASALISAYKSGQPLTLPTRTPKPAKAIPAGAPLDDINRLLQEL